MRKTVQSAPTPSEPVRYPSGVFVRTEKGYFFIADSSKRYRCITKRVLDSWAPQRVIETSEAALANYRVSAKLRFRNGSLIHSIADGKIYLISDGTRRHVTSPEALTLIGAVGNRSDTISVSLDEINLHPEGAPLN